VLGYLLPPGQETSYRSSEVGKHHPPVPERASVELEDDNIGSSVFQLMDAGGSIGGLKIPPSAANTCCDAGSRRGTRAGDATPYPVVTAVKREISAPSPAFLADFIMQGRLGSECRR